jgi:hypothetical protein
MGYEKKKKGRKANRGVDTAMPSVMDDKQWETREDLNAVVRAKAVNADPERMKRVKILAKQKLDESLGKKKEAEQLIKLGKGE